MVSVPNDKTNNVFKKIVLIENWNTFPACGIACLLQSLFPVTALGCQPLPSTKDCGILILTLLVPGNDVMADRGFDIKEDMPDGVSLNIPAPFLNGCTQRSLLMMKIKQEKLQS